MAQATSIQAILQTEGPARHPAWLKAGSSTRARLWAHLGLGEHDGTAMRDSDALGDIIVLALRPSVRSRLQGTIPATWEGFRVSVRHPASAQPLIAG